MVTDDLVASITNEAARLLPKPAGELEFRFKLAWAQAVSTDTVPHRGDDSFWRDVRQRLAREILQHATAGSVTVGMVAQHVIGWAQSVGLDLAHYRWPLSVLVALVSKSVFDELNARSESKGNGSQDGRR